MMLVALALHSKMLGEAMPGIRGVVFCFPRAVLEVFDSALSLPHAPVRTEALKSRDCCANYCICEQGQGRIACGSGWRPPLSRSTLAGLRSLSTLLQWPDGNVWRAVPL